MIVSADGQCPPDRATQVSRSIPLIQQLSFRVYGEQRYKFFQEQSEPVNVASCSSGMMAMRKIRYWSSLALALFACCCISPSALAQQQLPITYGNASGMLTSPYYAVDGGPSTLWNSGGPPTQWIDIDLYADRTVSILKLLPAQLPNGATTHYIYGRTAAGVWVYLGLISGHSADSQWITLNITEPTPIRFIIIQTTSGPSWVAWREVQVFEPARPIGAGDVVGRELSSTGLGPAGHIGFWDGGQVVQVMPESQVVQKVSYENFMSKSTVWAPVYTNIPGFTVKTCFTGQCEFYDPPYGISARVKRRVSR